MEPKITKKDKPLINELAKTYGSLEAIPNHTNGLYLRAIAFLSGAKLKDVIDNSYPVYTDSDSAELQYQKYKSDFSAEAERRGIRLEYFTFKWDLADDFHVSFTIYRGLTDVNFNGNPGFSYHGIDCATLFNNIEKIAKDDLAAFRQKSELLVAELLKMVKKKQITNSSIKSVTADKMDEAGLKYNLKLNESRLYLEVYVSDSQILGADLSYKSYFDDLDIFIDSAVAIKQAYEKNPKLHFVFRSRPKR
ncbi:MAG: hypothetical protein II951_09605 [Bacteroidales bacterium]|nr:hypothetical protein [Bacteroidales bacterium]